MLRTLSDPEQLLELETITWYLDSSCPSHIFSSLLYGFKSAGYITGQSKKHKNFCET
jgi:hypothetical protein